jgi:hypothetical protein
MVGALDLRSRPEHRAEQAELLAAQTLARFRGDAYRAVIFTQQHGAISARDALGHVALLAANRGQHPHAAFQRTIAGPTDSLALRAKLQPGPFREQAVEALLAERRAHRRDQFERQLCVVFRESRCSAFS